MYAREPPTLSQELWNNLNKDISLANYQLYETCRPDKKGGGTAVYVRSCMQSKEYKNFLYHNSKDFEITCVTLRPAYLPKCVSIIVVVCVYLPPNSKNEIHFQLFKSLSSLVENVRHKYKEPGFSIQGDFNKWKYLNSFVRTTNIKQLVDFPTFMHGKKKSMLDIVCTNLEEWYSKPSSIIPLKLSTNYHVCIEILPKDKFKRKETLTRKIKYRNYNNDNLSDFAYIVDNLNWDKFYVTNCIDFKVEFFNLVLQNAFEVCFKEKEKVLKVQNNMWVNETLLNLFKKVKKHRKMSGELRLLKNQISKEIKIAKQKYNESIQTKISSHKESIHSIANKICGLKQMTSPVEKIALHEKLSTHETLNKINSHFAEINNRYDPVQGFSESESKSNKTLCVSELAVLRAFEKLKVHKSNVPGALPVKFLKFAAIHIVPFYTHIVNYSFTNICVPNQWKCGFITPVPKDLNNICVENLRPITQTNVYSKIMEQFMFDRIYNQIITKLNENQFGAIKKSSTAHYLVSLFDFVLKSLEKPNTYVIIVLLDLSKAFDLVDHNNLISCLHNIGIENCDVMWIAEFLRDRKQCTRFQNHLSNFIKISNGTPQGTRNAILLFVVLVNELLVTFHNKFSNSKNLMHAFVDDMCIAEAVSYDETPEMNDYVKELSACMLKNKMCLNAKKSSVIIIDNSKDKRFTNIDITIDGETIPKAKISKLLGVIINDKANWNEHVDYIYSKACKKLYILRKLKCFGFSCAQLTTMYVLHIRSVLEYSSVLWANSLTLKQCKKLISVEKRALSIITKKYVSNSNYLSSCKFVNIISLPERWTLLLTKFGIKILNNARYLHWIEKYKINRTHDYANRQNKNKYNFRAVPAKFERYRRSTIPSLIRALREQECNKLFVN